MGNEDSQRIKELASSQNPEFIYYALLENRDLPLAIVEAKREERDAHAGKCQAEDYARRIREIHERDPFIFLTNGTEIWF